MKKYGFKPNFANFKDGYSQIHRKKVRGDTRYCPSCEQYKKFEEFYVRRKNNCSGWCRVCDKQYDRKRKKT